MRSILKLMAVISLMLTAGSAFADGLIYQLPKDGTFVLYDLDFKLTAGDQNIEAKGAFRVSSVGTVTENDKKCRWIEVKMTINAGGKDRVVIGKLLVPEENLKAGGNVFGSKIRGWVRLRENAEVKALDDDNSGPMPAFLCGPLNEAKELAAVVVDSKLGKLECKGVSGYTEFKDRGKDSRATFETRRHEKAPFGVVSTVIKFARERNGELKQEADMKFTLKETGTDATSDLPDSK